MQNRHDAIWARFLAGRVGASATPSELERARTREPLAHRLPTVSLYEGLVAFYRGLIPLGRLESCVDENEQLLRSADEQVERASRRRQN